MALIRVYDNDGKEHMKESVDARECVAVMGWSFTEPKSVEEPKLEPEIEQKPSLNHGNKNHFNPKK